MKVEIQVCTCVGIPYVFVFVHATVSEVQGCVQHVLFLLPGGEVVSELNKCFMATLTDAHSGTVNTEAKYLA